MEFSLLWPLLVLERVDRAAELGSLRHARSDQCAAQGLAVQHLAIGDIREDDFLPPLGLVPPTPRLDADHLPFEGAPDVQGGVRIPGATMAEIERHAILSTLDAVGGSTARAAEILDISVRTIQYRLHTYGRR
nr:helix-turn-helix domain-containing protein [Nannocystis exedens]